MKKVECPECFEMVDSLTEDGICADCVDAAEAEQDIFDEELYESEKEEGDDDDDEDR